MENKVGIVFIYESDEDLKYIVRICDILWERHMIKTICLIFNPAVNLTPSLRLIKEFKKSVVDARIFLVNHTKYHHQGILRHEVNLPINQLNFIPVNFNPEDESLKIQEMLFGLAKD